MSVVQASIYRLSSTSIIRGIAKLLEAIINKGFKAQVLCLDKFSMYKLDAALWTYSSLAFLPHATEEDEFLLQQKILLSTTLENLNDATVLLSNHTVPKSIQNYQRFVSIYEEMENESLIIQQIESLKKLNIPFTVFEENSGSWKK